MCSRPGSICQSSIADTCEAPRNLRSYLGSASSPEDSGSPTLGIDSTEVERHDIGERHRHYSVCLYLLVAKLGPSLLCDPVKVVFAVSGRMGEPRAGAFESCSEDCHCLWSSIHMLMYEPQQHISRAFTGKGHCQCVPVLLCSWL